MNASAERLTQQASHRFGHPNPFHLDLASNATALSRGNQEPDLVLKASAIEQLAGLAALLGFAYQDVSKMYCLALLHTLLLNIRVVGIGVDPCMGAPGLYRKPRGKKQWWETRECLTHKLNDCEHQSLVKSVLKHISAGDVPNGMSSRRFGEDELHQADGLQSGTQGTGRGPEEENP